jgi:hypothetical protein
MIALPSPQMALLLVKFSPGQFPQYVSSCFVVEF